MKFGDKFHDCNTISSLTEISR